jgi:hypothetical protein
MSGMRQQIDNNKGGGMGSSSPLATLLRRISGGLPQRMAPTFGYGGGGVLDNDGMDYNDRWWGVEGQRVVVK